MWNPVHLAKKFVLETKKMEKKSRLAKISIVLFCLLTFVLVGMAGISFAMYVSSVQTPGNAGVMEINCKYTVENSDLAFVNTPYQDGDSPVTGKGNTYSNTVIEVTNFGVNTGMSYQYAFVFYLPTLFANNSIFQLVQLDGNTAVSATPLYSFIGEDGRLNPTVQPDVSNDYDGLVNSEGGLLNVSFNCSKVSVAATYSRTFKTYQYANEPHGKVLCPITIKKTETVEYCRLVFNLDASKYFLGDGDSARFLLRVAPIKELNDELISSAWNPDDYIKDTLTTTSKGFTVKFNQSGNIDITYTDDDGTQVVYPNVYVGSCTGITFPSRMNVLFTQMENK